MTQGVAAVKNIYKVDPYCFGIEWIDGSVQEYRLSQLQKHCPCAACVDGKEVNENVRARRIVSVGRYALRVEFVSGCSSGIYDFDLLKKITKKGGHD